MSYLRDQNDVDVLAGKDHELTLSTAAIFAIFFGLVALCGIFFGFGYSLGSHKSPSVTAAAAATSGSGSATPNFSAFKPAAGQPLGSANKPSAAVVAAPAYTPAPAATRVAVTPASAPQPATPAPIVRVAPPTTPESVHPITLSSANQPPAPAGTLVVQVAAVSIAHPEDVPRTVNALRSKGYAVFTHSGPDQFIHILVGPFSTRSAAEAMVQRLSADGYTTYIK